MNPFSIAGIFAVFSFAAVVTGLTMGCMTTSSDSGGFTPAGDDAVMAGLTGTWVASDDAGTALTLTLCESATQEANAAETNDAGCPATYHIVKGGNRGTLQPTKPGILDTSAGPCDNYLGDPATAYLDGTLTGDGASPTKVALAFGLSSDDANALPFPYDVDFTGAGFDWKGKMPAAGSFTLDTTMFLPGLVGDPDAGPPVGGRTFHRTGDATCPPL